MKRPQEIKHIAETLYGYMDVAYDEGFEAGTKTMQECSWEKGVRDAWECIADLVDKYSNEPRMVDLMHDLYPVNNVKGYVERRNKEDLAKTEPIVVGDIVTRYDGRERMVTYIDKDFVYTLDLENSRDTLIYTLGELKKTGKKAVIRVFKPLAVGELK